MASSLARRAEYELDLLTKPGAIYDEIIFKTCMAFLNAYRAKDLLPAAFHEAQQGFETWLRQGKVNCVNPAVSKANPTLQVNNVREARRIREMQIADFIEERDYMIKMREQHEAKVSEAKGVQPV